MKYLIIFITFFFLFNTSAICSEYNTKDIFLYQTCDTILYEFFEDNKDKIELKKLEAVLYSENYKNFVLLNIKIYFNRYKINDDFDILANKNSYLNVKKILETKLFNELEN